MDFKAEHVKFIIFKGIDTDFVIYFQVLPFFATVPHSYSLGTYILFFVFCIQSGYPRWVI